MQLIKIGGNLDSGNDIIIFFSGNITGLFQILVIFLFFHNSAVYGHTRFELAILLSISIGDNIVITSHSRRKIISMATVLSTRRLISSRYYRSWLFQDRNAQLFPPERLRCKLCHGLC